MSTSWLRSIAITALLLVAGACSQAPGRGPKTQAPSATSLAPASGGTFRLEIIQAKINADLAKITGPSTTVWKPKALELWRAGKLEPSNCPMIVRFSNLKGAMPLGNYAIGTTGPEDKIRMTGTVPMERVPAEPGRHFSQLTLTPDPTTGVVIVYLPANVFLESADPIISVRLASGAQLYGTPRNGDGASLNTAPNNPSRNSSNTVLDAIRNNPHRNHSMYVLVERGECNAGGYKSS